MDQGTIKCIKAHSYRNLVRVSIKTFDQTEDLPKISVVPSLQLPTVSWNDVIKATVFNRFQRANIFRENKIDTVENSNNLFEALQDNHTELPRSNLNLVKLIWNRSGNCWHYSRMKLQQQLNLKMKKELQMTISISLMDLFKTLQNL